MTFVNRRLFIRNFDFISKFEICCQKRQNNVINELRGKPVPFFPANSCLAKSLNDCMYVGGGFILHFVHFCMFRLFALTARLHTPRLHVHFPPIELPF